MGRLIDGEWLSDVTNDDRVDFDYEETEFRSAIGTDRHPADPERYHLYVSRACPWAHGTLLTRALLGLDDAIGISVVDPHRRDDGWEFTPEKAGCTPDRLHDTDYLRDVYTTADSNYTGRVSVPVLWDEAEGTIVNEESDEIMRTLADAFADYRGADLYPAGHREAIDRYIGELYRPLNRGVYRAGFAETQSAYESAVETVFEALDRWEAHLSDRRYLLGDRLTLADLRLFPTLVRFDAVYHTHFKCTVRRLVDYPNLWGFTRDVYQTRGVPGTVNLDHVKEHYYRSHEQINPTGFVPVGPAVDFEASHNRDELPGMPPTA
ncbi:glutathione S-transferase family protein [Halosimplex amylolyticum]|uniref:glutathione S-transferase family protein n=1 Tax=Halosimplex amylolyticum TaxID=3396616 RepID=UPI003F5542F7